MSKISEYLKNLSEKIAQLKILVIGDLMLDRYIFGEANRISPEAPVPVVEVDHEKEVLGAATNVALNLRSMGVETTVVGMLGEDLPGESLKSLLGKEKIRYLNAPQGPQKHSVKTILKTRIIVRQQQLCRLDIEEDPEKYAIQDEAFIQKLLDQIERYDAIIFSDYAKGVLYQSLVDRVTQQAHAQGVIVAADPKPKNGIHFYEADILKPNYSEALEMLGKKGAFDIRSAKAKISLTEICQEIFQKDHPKHLVITLGKEGMLVASEGNVRRKIPSYAREVFDVSGAGDTSIAFLTAAYAAGEPIENAARLANLAAGIVVGKIGTATVTAAEILRENKFE